MKTHNINIDKNQNPEFAAIIDENQSITIEYNRINNLFIRHRVPRLFLLKRRKQLLAIANEAFMLNERFLTWDEKADNFLIHPKLLFNENVDAETSFYHYMNILREIRATGRDAFDAMSRNYNRLYDAYAAQINFLIAIFSFAISFAGLVASLIGLIIAIKMLG